MQLQIYLADFRDKLLLDFKLNLMHMSYYFFCQLMTHSTVALQRFNAFLNRFSTTNREGIFRNSPRQFFTGPSGSISKDPLQEYRANP